MDWRRAKAALHAHLGDCTEHAVNLQVLGAVEALTRTGCAPDEADLRRILKAAVAAELWVVVRHAARVCPAAEVAAIFCDTTSPAARAALADAVRGTPQAVPVAVACIKTQPTSARHMHQSLGITAADLRGTGALRSMITNLSLLDFVLDVMGFTMGEVLEALGAMVEPRGAPTAALKLLLARSGDGDAPFLFEWACSTSTEALDELLRLGKPWPTARADWARALDAAAATWTAKKNEMPYCLERVLTPEQAEYFLGRACEVPQRLFVENMTSSSWYMVAVPPDQVQARLARALELARREDDPYGERLHVARYLVEWLAEVGLGEPARAQLVGEMRAAAEQQRWRVVEFLAAILGHAAQNVEAK